METTLLETPRFRVVQLNYRTSEGASLNRAVIRHPGAVTLIPLVDKDRICLIRNHRVAVGETLLELPAGTREVGEPPERTAHRELIEETGYSAKRIRQLHEFYLSPGILDERMFLFLAEQLEDVGPDREVGEEIENVILPFEEALQKVDSGEIQDAKTIVGLLFYARYARDC